VTLQDNIGNLLTFFTDISDYVELLYDNAVDEAGFIGKVRLPEHLSHEERDACLDIEVHHTAIDLKARFKVMQKIAQTYSQVSKQYIMPGFTIISKLTISESFLNDSQVQARSTELSHFNLEAANDIWELVSTVREILEKVLERDMMLIHYRTVSSYRRI
jgi:hypothetical protein